MKKNIKNEQGFIYSIFNGNKLNQKDIDSIINYDYTSGYPEKLIIEIE